MQSSGQARNGDKEDAAGRTPGAPDKSGNDNTAAPKAGQGATKAVSTFPNLNGYLFELSV